MQLVLLWDIILIKPLFNSLLFFNYYTHSLGISLVILTLIIKVILLPLNIPSIKMQLAKKKLDGKIDELKEKHTDKTEFAKAQMALFKEHGINPASGCLPMILQLIVIFALLNVFNLVLRSSGNYDSYIYFDFLKNPSWDNHFLYLDLFKPDKFYILPVLAGIAQYFVTKLTVTTKKDETPKKTEKKSDDLQGAMEKQMLYMSPLLTTFFGFNLPSGIVLYWFVSTVFSYLQTILIKKLLNNYERS